MLYNLQRDPRVPIAYKIARNLLAELECAASVFMITEQNDLVINMMDAVLCCIHMKEFDNYPPMHEIVYDCFPKDINGERMLVDEDQYIPSPPYIVQKMHDLYNQYVVNCNTMSPVASDNSLRDNNTFESLLSLKASNGVRFFRMLGLDMHTYYMIPIMSGFPRLNKPDTIGIDVYVKGGNQIVKMSIFKKKIGRDCQMYYRALVI